MSQFADVILPLPLYKYFTYRIPDDMRSCLQQGSRVVVPFGRKKYYTAIVAYLHDLAPVGYETKEIISLLDDKPVLRRPQLRFWEWIAEYYLCSVGDVYKAALPSGLKLESETTVTLNGEYEESEEVRLKDRELILLDTLSRNGKMSLSELERETGLKNILPVVRGLLEKEALFVSEQIKNNYKPKTEVYVRMSFPPEEKDLLKEVFDKVKSAKKQEVLLLSYLDLSCFMRKGMYREVSRKDLLERSAVSVSILNAMIAKGIFVKYKKEVSRFASLSLRLQDIAELSEVQKRAYEQITDSFRTHDVTLLHGVTSSGKTEIYIHLIKQVVDAGRQVLYLVPEIALTTQLTTRLQRVFGDKLIIYHSKFSDNERVDIWNNLLNEKKSGIILGVRSSIFLPFRDLGLVIVDEEHENSYKQYDPAPRYHARNAAVVLASMHGAKTLLGTATPSIETYYNARQGKYGLVELLSRFEELELPLVEIADVKELRRKRRMSGNFSPVLIDKASQALKQGEQVILFQNRRGFAPLVECKECAWIPKCEHLSLIHI